MDNKKRRIVGTTAVSAAAMVSMLGIAAPAHAETSASSTTQLPAVQNALIKVDTVLLKLERSGVPSAGIENAFQKVESIFLKLNGNPG